MTYLSGNQPEGVFAYKIIEPHEYLLSLRQETWYTARDLCNHYGHKLARFGSALEQFLVADWLLSVPGDANNKRHIKSIFRCC